MSRAVSVGVSKGAGPGHVTRSMGAAPTRDEPSYEPSYERDREEIPAGHRRDGISRSHHEPGQGARLCPEYVAPEGDR